MKTNRILATQFLLLPADMHLEEVLIDKNRLMLVLSSTQSSAACPSCSQLSARVHSRYMRTLMDLPCQERAVVLRVRVRRFFCLAAACAHQTFAEQFPTLAPAYARRTYRQFQRLCQIAFALGGRPGARLAKQQAMPTSFSSLLRLLRHSAAPFFPSPHVLGIDDFGATRSYMSSCEDSRKEALTWSSASSAEPSLNQERLGQCSRTHKGGLTSVRK